jgi:hemerythrin
MSALHFEWTEAMSVGEDTIDAQHRRLLAQLNKVIDAMASDATSEAAAEALRFFEQYVAEHLAYEEAYMQRRGYAEIEEHKKQHQAFRDTYAEFKMKLESGAAPFAVIVAMEEFLGEWWIHHIGREDQKYHRALGDAR